MRYLVVADGRRQGFYGWLKDKAITYPTLDPTCVPLKDDVAETVTRVIIDFEFGNHDFKYLRLLIKSLRSRIHQGVKITAVLTSDPDGELTELFKELDVEVVTNRKARTLLLLSAGC